MRHVRRFTLICLALALIACNRAAPSPPAPKIAAHNPDPVIVVTYDGGMGDPTIRTSCIRLAVWDDGTALTCTDPLLADGAMAVGCVDPAQLASALADIEAAGFFDHPPISAWAPDSQNYRITARSKGRTRTHGAMTLDQSTPEWWAPCGAAVQTLTVTDTHPISDVATGGVFRGYVMAKWWQTPWR